MAEISKETIERIKNSANIVDVIGKYVDLQKRGSNWFGLCPFVPEDTPSFSVNEDRKTFRCFSCGRHGDVFGFMQEMKGLSFPEAIVEVGHQVGIQVNYSTNIKSKYDENQKKLIDINNKATSALEFILKSEYGKLATDYLTGQRHLNNETISKFRIGYNSSDWDIYKWLENEKVQINDAVESGLLSVDEQGKVHNRFLNRIIFPLIDRYGNVLALSGRSLEKNTNSKYLNGSETSIFKKNEFLFNLNNAINESRISNKLLLLEGYMDVVSADAAGIRYATASMGTSLTENQIKEIVKITKKIQIAYDGDTAGQDATWRAINLIKKHSNLEITITVFPDNLDPDDYIQKYGPEKFKNLIDNSNLSINEFALNYLKNKRNLSFQNDLIAYINDVLSFIANEKQLEKNFVINELQKITNINKDALLGTLKSIELQEQKTPSKNDDAFYEIALPEIETVKPIVNSKNEEVERERTLLASAIEYPEIKNILIDKKFRFKTENNQKVFLLLKGTPVGYDFKNSIQHDTANSIYVQSLVATKKYLDRNIESIYEHLYTLDKIIPKEKEIDTAEDELKQSQNLNQIETSLKVIKKIGELKKELKELKNGKKKYD
jgi:DNA primase